MDDFNVRFLLNGFVCRAGMDLEPGWPCNGPLLRMAEDVVSIVYIRVVKSEMLLSFIRNNFRQGGFCQRLIPPRECHTER